MSRLHTVSIFEAILAHCV